jgi:hypothetical protein
MVQMSGRWRFLAGAAVVLACTSTVALAVLPAPDIMAIHRTALNVFVQPGVVLWWLLLAGPYQFAPTTLAGYSAIVIANTGCWCLGLWCVAAVARGAVTRLGYLLLTPGLAVASLAIMVMRGSSRMIPSVVRDPLANFVDPGVTAWWLILGNLFQSFPSSLAGMAFAALANTLLWLLALRMLVAVSGFVRRKIRKSPS